jgi:predicted nucleic acid-binding protein
MSQRVRTQLYLSKEAHDRPRELAKESGETVSELVRKAVDEVYLSQWSADARVLVPAMTVTEIVAASHPLESALISTLFDAFRIVEVDRETALLAGGYLVRFRHSHRLELPEALVAATAVRLAEPLWTRHPGRYPIDDLILYDDSRKVRA